MVWLSWFYIWWAIQWMDDSPKDLSDCMISTFDCGQEIDSWKGGARILKRPNTEELRSSHLGDFEGTPLPPNHGCTLRIFLFCKLLICWDIVPLIFPAKIFRIFYGCQVVIFLILTVFIFCDVGQNIADFVIHGVLSFIGVSDVRYIFIFIFFFKKVSILAKKNLHFPE